jgi:hypothetical protein
MRRKYAGILLDYKKNKYYKDYMGLLDVEPDYGLVLGIGSRSGVD